MDNTVLCVRWGDKYDDTYVKKLKEQLDRHLTVPFNFYCLTDNPKEEYDIQLPTSWDEYYRAQIRICSGRIVNVICLMRINIFQR